MSRPFVSACFESGVGLLALAGLPGIRPGRGARGPRHLSLARTPTWVRPRIPFEPGAIRWSEALGADHCIDGSMPEARYGMAEIRCPLEEAAGRYGPAAGGHHPAVPGWFRTRSFHDRVTRMTAALRRADASRRAHRDTGAQQPGLPRLVVGGLRLGAVCLSHEHPAGRTARWRILLRRIDAGSWCAGAG